MSESFNDENQEPAESKKVPPVKRQRNDDENEFSIDEVNSSRSELSHPAAHILRLQFDEEDEEQAEHRPTEQELKNRREQLETPLGRPHASLPLCFCYVACAILQEPFMALDFVRYMLPW